jgi:hypothetical protein
MPNFPIELLMAYLVCHYFMALQVNYAINNYRHGLPARLAERDLIARFGEQRGAKLARDLAIFFKYLFPSYVVVEAIIGILFLLYLGMARNWLWPLMLIFSGWLMQFFILKLDSRFPLPNRAWIMSLVGLVVLPLTLTYMMRFIY